MDTISTEKVRAARPGNTVVHLQNEAVGSGNEAVRSRTSGDSIVLCMAYDEKGW